jgi:hypothetical protein
MKNLSFIILIRMKADDFFKDINAKMGNVGILGLTLAVKTGKI